MYNIPKEFETLLDLEIDKKASELHIQSNTNAFLVLEGQMFDTGIFIDENLLWQIKEALVSETIYYGLLIDNKSTDFSYHYKDNYRFRISIVESFKGLKLSIRNNNFKIKTFRELGFKDDIWSDIITQSKGLILVAGATSSGKSTTVSTLITEFIKQKRCIISLEDPVEFIYDDTETSITQRELHTNFYSYADGIRDAMRMAPDVIVVNELRDKDTIDATLTAAETGHLVVASVHTKSVDAIENRLILSFPEGEQNLKREILKETLIMKIHQSLIFDNITKRLRLVYEYKKYI